MPTRELRNTPQQQAQLELYDKLTEAELCSGECEDFNAVAQRMREKLVQKYHGEV
jgi:hypothetical protein